MPPIDEFTDELAEDEEEALEMAAAMLDMAIRQHLARRSDAELTEIEMEAANEFVQSKSRNEVYQLLREQPKVGSTDLSEVIRLVGPEAGPVGDTVFETLQRRTSGELYGSSPEEQRAELAGFLGTIDGLIDGPSPPLTVTPDDVDLRTERSSSVSTIVGFISKWLNQAEPETFLALWSIPPDGYLEPCEALIERSATSEWLFGPSTVDMINNSSMGASREWLTSMCDVEHFSTGICQREVEVILMLLDNTVIIGLYRQFTSNGTEAMFRTTDPAVREWAQEVFEGYRNQSEEVRWQEDSNPNTG
jgi:hypothetical protein